MGMKMNDNRKHMIRTNLRQKVQLKEAILLKKLHSEVIAHGMRHIGIWQQIRRHCIDGFSDKCGIFENRQNMMGSPASCRRHSFSNRQSPYLQGNKKEDYDEDDVSVCSVCFDGTFTDLNPIIFCDHCNIGVHRYCYGINKIPNEHTEWICASCTYLKSNNNQSKKNNNQTLVPQCCLCPIAGGALKRTK